MIIIRVFKCPRNTLHVKVKTVEMEFVMSQWYIVDVFLFVGPIRNTCADMWRMVWSEDSPTIVMLTCLIESSKVGRSQPEIVVRNVSSSVSCMVCQIKCHQYWPKSIDESIVYNGIAVTLTNEETFADYVLRTIHLRLVWPLNIL